MRHNPARPRSRPPVPTDRQHPARDPDRDAGLGRDRGDRDAGPGDRDPLPDRHRHDRRLAAADPETSRFAQALLQGGIYETLNGTGTYTVFTPDDAAFDAVPPGTLSRLLFDRDALATVANYLVAYGRWLSADLARQSSIATARARRSP